MTIANELVERVDFNIVRRLFFKLDEAQRLKLIAEAEREKKTKASSQDKSTKQKRIGESVYGLWTDLGIDITEEDIKEARKEMWGNFPRDDI